MKIVVIGNSMVGHNFIEKLYDSDLKDKIEVITFGEEPYKAYDRVHLTSYFDGSSVEDLSLVKENFYEDNNIDLHLNDKVISVNIKDKTVTSKSGEVVNYDKLVFATGSSAFIPPIKGNDRKNCFGYRNIQDLDNIKEASKNVKIGVVIGGGLLGLEAAKALKDLNLETHVVEFASRLMPMQLDDGGSILLKKKIKNLGVTVHTNKTTLKIDDGVSHTNKLYFSDKEELETDLIVFSAGIRARDEIAKDIGLDIGERGGIIINNYCLTSNEDIYAIGECALWNKKVFGLIAPGYAMAKVALEHLRGNTLEFNDFDMSAKLKLMGVEVGSIGDPHIEDSLSYVYENGPKEIYKKIVVSRDEKRLLGAVLVGDTSDYGNLLQLMLNGMELPEHPDSLILPNVGDTSDLFGPAAIPKTAQVCSCYDVTKGDIIDAVTSVDTTFKAIKEKTKATTGCGGCTQLVKDIFNMELKNKGAIIDNSMCEHFKYTRSDLYNIIKVEDIQTFKELIKRHGKGKGCEICKPTVASILGSIHNAYALDAPNINLQDTNDRFLANMQKNGTYSIIPRVAGGEITPAKLIVLGEVADEYKLYTKINGAQRIVLFGAFVNDLPSIWKKLIDAGFESGQAYAKSLRTVKSCVGSTWCRYGIDDSVKLAIDLENRYKGLRSPHKIKMGVSGCIRECAEARSKDIGVIATENGWSLYVCGNGGMQPRHGDLFATNLDRKTLFLYIDRILMFYIKTADRLQRTARWMETLDGGLKYLQDVVIYDKLELNSTFEEQMDFITTTYKCDWESALEDEEHFKTFANVDDVDPKVELVEERGQLRPANIDIVGPKAEFIEEMEQSRLANKENKTMREVCSIDDLVDHSGVCVLVNDMQIAIFYIDDTIYAINNYDPIGKAHVLSRGIIGHIDDRIYVSSPLYKDRYDLSTGKCLENENISTKAYKCKMKDDKVYIELNKSINTSLLP